MLLGVLLSAAAWVRLVAAAVDFATLARAGNGAAWALTTAASVGAVGCLVLVLSLGTRLLYALGVVSDYRPRRAAGRRRR